HLYYRDRLTIPDNLKTAILIQLHSGHQGKVKCKALAKNTVYWPGINLDIESFVSKCLVCAEFAPSQQTQKMISLDIPDLTYEQVAVDIPEYKGQFYLVVMDSYSKWLDAIQLKNKTSQSVIDVLQFLFSIHGIPRVVLADNNPFKSHSLLKKLNFTIVSCSPHYHQSNGLAERAVDPKASPQTCLLQYRITLLAGLDASPAPLLVSRQLRSTIPVHVTKLKPSIIPNVKANLIKWSQISKDHYDKSSNRKEIEFNPSDYVFMQNPLTHIWEPGIIMEKCTEPRSYLSQPKSPVPYCTPVFMLPASETNVPILNEIPHNDLDQDLNQNLQNNVNEITVELFIA
ncbi:hypothetical protein KUF71_014158, partial [Frankliniella fusca]